MQPFAGAGGFELYYMTPAKQRPGPVLYLSAGIHGDEPGATEGLIAWAEGSRDFLRGYQTMIFPCLNPWGLCHNNRLDSRGRDLNRCYHENRVPQVAAHKKLLRGRRFHLAVALHEDYDAPGMYVYEIPNSKPYLAESILALGSHHVPVDPRKRIEGRPARSGVERKTIRPDLLPGHPEAFFLHFYCADRTLTVETPSEFCLDQRVAAHGAGLQAVESAFLAAGRC